MSGKALTAAHSKPVGKNEQCRSGAKITAYIVSSYNPPALYFQIYKEICAMLLSVGRQRYISESAADSVHNYYEHMVFEQLIRAYKRAAEDTEFLADVACVALNRLPPRYVRHDVDMTFFMTPIELEDMINKVVKAVNDAVDYVESREKEKEKPESDTSN